ncbi:hypothetical protein [Glycomyces niveus]|uniref:Uncharacterized protein n=1 Tax=Glycomyces niveus TaxID=2820287 RepID=A0ABS3TYM2_9ACTN|nr:hypothetical protein [Glycomyces sp. NEAU-S30]MBO3731603.1 hypothetical protein [Glycomyces sp. NEAU-S30]
MTELSAFTGDDLDLILDTPGVVMKGAIVADGHKNALAFLKEVTAGAKEFRAAQKHENAFVKAVATALRERGTDAETDDRELPFDDQAMTQALKQAQAATALLRERAEAPDAEAYGAWLLQIATVISESVKTKEGGFFSKKVAVSEGERVFLEHLAQAIGR